MSRQHILPSAKRAVAAIPKLQSIYVRNLLLILGQQKILILDVTLYNGNEYNRAEYK